MSLGIWFGVLNREEAPAQPAIAPASCPAEMVRVRNYCVDRFEMSTLDHRSARALSPFYPPHPKLLESALAAWSVERRRVGMPEARTLPLPLLPEIQYQERDYQPRAVSRPGVVPQGYLSQWLAKLACENAGKRLCTEEEWVTACRGSPMASASKTGAATSTGTCIRPRYCTALRSTATSTRG
jgi:hypothetical protein